ncbi:MAG: patatin-like phospholipase family protein [Legionella sp.]|nr:patatin-like phospholipase family protein [Legionella sp.]
MKTLLFRYFPCFLFPLMIVLPACTSSGLYKPLPQQFEQKATITGYKNIRVWGDSTSKAMELNAEQSYQQMLKSNGGHLPPIVNALALSGGGADGAFGAGLLYGWGKAGNRPTFHLVSGISTGALMAPFAFLGHAYDDRLKLVYTTLSDKHIYELHNPFTILSSYIKPILKPSIASNKPMKQMMEKIFDQHMLDDIGNAHKQGRRLFIGTTQLNAQRLVIWDIGAIAVSGNPNALSLVHKILMASSALPGLFPPQYFEVKSDGKYYQEMHMDGGVETQVMLYEKAIVPFAKIYINSTKDHENKLYIIRNRKVCPEWENVKPRLHTMLERVIFTLTKTQGIGDLYRLYAYAMRDHIDYNLAFIPANFKKQAKSPFDGDYMKELFNIGQRLGLRGYPWKKYPPGLFD